MSVVIIAVLVVAALVAGHFLVRRVMRSTVKERERQLAIARGQAEPEVAKPKKKNKGWRLTGLPDVPEHIIADLRLRVPAMVHAYLQSRARLAELAPQLYTAQVEFDTTVANCSRVFAKIDSRERSDFAEWLAEATAAVVARRAAGRRQQDVNAQYQSELSRYNKAWESLRDWVVATWKSRHDKTNKYDVEGLDDDQLRTMRIARRVYLTAEYSYAPAPGTSISTPNVPPSQTTPLDSANAILDTAADDAEALYKLIPESELLRERTDEAMAAFRENAKVPAIAAPAKPMETDVQTFVEQWLAWATSVNATEVQCRTLLPPLDTALAHYGPLCASLETGLKLIEDPHGRQLTDEQVGRFEALQYLAKNWRARIDLLARTLNVHAQTLRVWFDNEPNAVGIDTKSATLLQTLLRKIAFAVAQRDAAAAKLAQIEEAKVEPAQVNEPRLSDEGLDTPEHLIRAVRSWNSETQRVRNETTQRNERLQAQRQQLEDRRRQLSETLSTLALLVRDLSVEGAPLPSEPQSRYIRVARAVSQWLTPPAAPAPTPSSSSKDKDKKKKKKR